MKILITNDDGVWARGIRVLAERIARQPEYEVYVVAPDRERSATGHALTLHKPLRVAQAEMEGKMRGVWWTTGTAHSRETLCRSRPVPPASRLPVSPLPAPDSAAPGPPWLSAESRTARNSPPGW